MTEIRWTRTEAMACAYCWAEWPHPETRTDTPEQYWLSVSERTRQECRRIVKSRRLVAVAMRQAASLPPPANLTTPNLAELATALGLKTDSRVRRILRVLYDHFLPRPWSNADRAAVQAQLVAAGDPGALEEDRLMREVDARMERGAA